ncbi:hypothetical protein BDN72DRAFT_329639 [Pluteus cervinus]|uniref:Uncharacterized protein n=1 Tax=Pluteus cervinus TaxID=181527 RepID=A0ACD3ACI8_9AGAR|nr:hypothetical protein BDN72DRAFT_329639 [Pluteus cervinus]
MRFVFYTTFALSFISSALALPSTKGDAAAVGDVLTGLTSLVATLAGVVQGFTLNATVTGAVSVQTEVSLILEAVNAATVLVSQAPPATVVQGEVILVALGNLATQSQVVLVLFKTASGNLGGGD